MIARASSIATTARTMSVSGPSERVSRTTSRVAAGTLAAASPVSAEAPMARSPNMTAATTPMDSAIEIHKTAQPVQ